MNANPFRFEPVPAPADGDGIAPAATPREQLKTRLAAAFRLLHQLGMSLGVAGHLSARDPEHEDRFWVNPFGVGYGEMRASLLSLVTLEGVVLEGGPINAAAFAIHAAVHRARPDVACVAHGHPEHATAWCALGRPLDPINQDVCALYGDHAVFEEDSGLVLGLDEGARIAAALGGQKALLLRNHGPLTVGRGVEEALWWFVLIERSARIQLLAEAAGRVHALPPEQARGIARGIGTSAFGAFQGRPLLRQVLRSQPEVAS